MNNWRVDIQKGVTYNFSKIVFLATKILEINANTIAQTIFFPIGNIFILDLEIKNLYLEVYWRSKGRIPKLALMGNPSFFFERRIVSLFLYRLWYLASSPSSVNLVRHQLPEKFRFICVYLCPTSDFVRVRHGRSSNFAIKSVVFLKKPVFSQKGIVAHIFVHILMYYNYHYSF